MDAVRVTDPAMLPILVSWTEVALNGVTVTRPEAGVSDQVTELPGTSELLREYTSDVQMFPAPESVYEGNALEKFTVSVKLLEEAVPFITGVTVTFPGGVVPTLGVSVIEPVVVLMVAGAGDP